ncbi:hypothetical protein PYCCODRAFT_718958 [Trametes coccinea BRFM310]|uniref:Uncharacterized protein n=1 Tax=Trametes coccinea (strain BRFM310) TaxID=1353009 RepID=A0A1Y2IG91_TRAC3|nr:hypothetical protein PYCCODRAFT_718958 [Trametes coccinea BRFM310]
MSDYNDSGAHRATPHDSFYPESLQGRPQSGYPPSSTRRAPRYSRATAPSWVSNGMLSPPPFTGPPSTAGSRPLPIPSPAPSRGASEFRPQSRYPPASEAGDAAESYRGQEREPETDDWEPETERMTIGPSVDDHYEYAPYAGDQYQAAPEYEHRAQAPPHQDSFYDPIGPTEPPPEAKPKPKRNFVGGFVAGLRRLPKAMVRSHLYDRKATRKGAPGTELETGPSHYLPAYDDPGVTVTDPASVHYVEAVEMPTGPRSPSQISYADPTRPSSHARSQRHSGQSAPHSVGRPTSPRIVTTPPMSPVLVTPHPASDYAKMDSPVRQAPPDDSFSAHVSRVKGFLHELKALPWTSSRVALDYIPAQGSRASVGKAKPVGSWYTGVRGHQDIDLLGSGRPTPRRLRSEDGGGSVRSAGARIAIAHDGRTPASFITSPGLMPSPGMSSHGHGQHPMSYSYYFAPPQPLYVYQSPMTTPATNPALTDSPSSSGSQREPTQAVPVYMMAGPPPGLIPTPPPAAHTPGHNQATRASPNAPPPVLPVTQAASHHSRATSH